MVALVDVNVLTDESMGCFVISSDDESIPWEAPQMLDQRDPTAGRARRGRGAHVPNGGVNRNTIGQTQAAQHHGARHRARSLANQRRNFPKLGRARS